MSPSPHGGTPEQGVERASERVTLACRALTAAVRDLRVAHKQSGVHALIDAGDAVSAETERVCELAEDVAKLATNLGETFALARRGV